LLSDLRESGCLSSTNQIYLITEDISVPLLDFKRGFSSSTSFGKSSRTLTPLPCFIKKIFSTGQKPTYVLETFGFYYIEITSTHKFLSFKGWVTLSRMDTLFSLATLDRFNYYKNRCYTSVQKVGLNITFLLTRSLSFFSIDFVYDIWAPSLGNFVSNNVFVHNSIEQDADVVLMLYREQYYLPNLKENNITEVIIAKQRNGPIGTINLIFDPKLVSFENFVLLD
jgi:replicative DNA helicase